LSALTKIAVVLLVVASLLLSAGVVVFVNKAEDFNKRATDADVNVRQLSEARSALSAQNQALAASMTQQAQSFNSRLDAVKQESGAKDAQILDLRNQLTKLDQDKKGIEVALGAAMKTQEGLQTQLGSATAQIADLRKIRDQVVEERHSLNVQLTDALSKLDQTERARKNAEERASTLRSSLSDLESKVESAGFNFNTLPNRTNRGTPALEGVVSSVFQAGGKPWAYISLGSKDNVTKDMKFNVVNNNQFLGYLTIQSTEPNAAAGVLEGPAVDKVKSGDQVKTQLQ
jgi:septal ring factor EnvC (AmiA/AmiB activator)